MASASSEKRNVTTLFWPSCHLETQKKSFFFIYEGDSKFLTDNEFDSIFILGFQSLKLCAVKFPLRVTDLVEGEL